MRLKSVTSPHAIGGCTVGRPFEEVETVKPSVRYAEPTCAHGVWSCSALSVYFFPLALANTMGLLRREWEWFRFWQRIGGEAPAASEMVLWLLSRACLAELA